MCSVRCLIFCCLLYRPPYRRHMGGVHRERFPANVEVGEDSFRHPNRPVRAHMHCRRQPSRPLRRHQRRRHPPQRYMDRAISTPSNTGFRSLMAAARAQLSPAPAPRGSCRMPHWQQQYAHPWRNRTGRSQTGRCLGAGPLREPPVRNLARSRDDNPVASASVRAHVNLHCRKPDGSVRRQRIEL